MANINLELSLLRTLVAFADSGSFSLAAQLVGRTQPSVSMQMRRLADLAGNEIFERRGRHITLTDFGIKMALQARDMLTMHDRIVDDLRGSVVQNPIRIGIPDDYATIVLPRIMEHLDRLHPNAPMNITTSTSPKLNRLLESGDLDLAIVATASPEKRDVFIQRETIVWVSAPDHDVHRRNPLPLALFSDESPIYRATVAALPELKCPKGNVRDIDIRLRSGSWSVLTTAVTHGFAVATMAEAVVPPHLQIMREADGFPDIGHIDIVLRPTSDSQSVTTAKLIKEILKTFQSESHPV